MAELDSMGRRAPSGSDERLLEDLSSTDVYLIDQLLKCRVPLDAKILDAGCGGGRNLRYFLRRGYDVAGVDGHPEAIAAVQQLRRELAPQLPKDRFRLECVEAMSFADNSFDFVISNAVLHFARDDEQFFGMLEEMWRVLSPGGVFFARLASAIGLGIEPIPLQFGPLRPGAETGQPCRWFRLPDGGERYLVDRELLMEATERLGGDWLEPLKTTVVDQARCMTTWVLRAR